ncbi:unnamed protein product [Leptidea sinapis]|uniref:Uncharacterized protein n=1 Tax=Leptidea sinapis TaxID=189913 RepID=A0A5E4QV22_9NEOP|nr:unnamed protein product [Leptidea sinapis]
MHTNTFAPDAGAPASAGSMAAGSRSELSPTRGSPDCGAEVAAVSDITCLLALSATTRAYGTDGLVYAPGHASPDYYAYPSYAFEYSVRDPHTGDNKAQWEKRDGDVVTGAYSLVEPDGSIRVVDYRADDKTGFQANVKRIGPNVHPVATPIYKANIPVLGHAPLAPIVVGPVAKYIKSAPAFAPAPILPLPAPILPPPAPLLPPPAPLLPPPAPLLPPTAPILPAPLPVPKPWPLPLPKPGYGYGPPLAPAPIYAAPAPILPAPLPLPKPWPLPDYPQYAYNYAVYDPVTNDKKAQWETRDGDVVKGSYSLVEPDGTLRVVEYNADDHRGFNAIVKKIGESIHPSEAVKLVPFNLKSPVHVPLRHPAPKLAVSVPANNVVLADSIRYGLGATSAAIGVPRIVYEKSSLPWDPISGSYGGWRPLPSYNKGLYATIYNTKYIDGNISGLLAYVAVATGNPYGYGLLPPNPNYNFNYAVNDPSTGDNKAQWEAREGDQVRGAYSLVEPDGNTRTVEYTADPVRGFNAVVRRTGPNVHSVSIPVVAAAVVEQPVVQAEVAPVQEIVTPIEPAPVPYPSAPILPPAPLPYDHVAPVAPLPVNYGVDPGLYAPLPQYNYPPLSLPYPAPSSYLQVSSTTYGKHGNIVRRWATGPISTHGGNTVTVRSRYNH